MCVTYVGKNSTRVGRVLIGGCRAGIENGVESVELCEIARRVHEGKQCHQPSTVGDNGWIGSRGCLLSVVVSGWFM